MTVVSEKERLRDQMRTLRRQLDASWRERASAAIISRLETLPIFLHAQAVQTYVALCREVDTHELIRRLLRAGKQVAAPKVESGNELQQYFIKDFSELHPGAFGILEPPAHPSRLASPEQFDLVLVPGLAFDRAGHRLGAGKGYYDRFLAQIKAPKIALAFAFQIVEQIPVEAHDQRVNVIVTEKEVISCS
ncbi:MAG: 5-formyltetrahydrofolate cyclo-ligase [candidate division KSB1 bacterium]|nr:5-formyltetrahydrofolate cyclo-ligase [candidate division KSB1 bacterium]MDZ7367312.1 5-formyltetrahydrofolate cyclo-ligase [candidate division KSB1 bacterium]MDZ7405849.1 5-formyltetrahydrofolate cyclo-ligase [candidate division KSB1 bacterium]